MTEAIVFDGKILRTPVIQQVELGQRPTAFVFKYIREGANLEMNVNGSITPVEYKYTVPAGKFFYWTRTVFHVKDSGSKPNDFGGIGGGLTNGLLMSVRDSGDAELVDLLDTLPIKTNSDHAHLASVDVDIKDAQGGADDSFVVRWTLEKAGAAMVLQPAEYFMVTVRDDLQALTSFLISVHGLLYDI